MKKVPLFIGLILLVGWAQISWAQSTTGGRSGGSTASTGTGYLTEGKRAATTDASSMTIADEGASRAYMYVPPTGSKTKNRAASPNGSTRSTSSSSAAKPVSTKPSATGKPSNQKSDTYQ